MDIAAAYVDPEKEVPDTAAALAGASDILAEQVAETAAYRENIRRMTADRGMIVCSAKDETASSVYENYYDYQESIRKAAGHRILAINRGEKEKFLTVKIEAPDEEKFPSLRLAREALRAGGAACAVLNGANEEAVAKFLRGDIPFGDIYRLVEKAMERLPGLPADSFDDVFEADRRAREVVREAAG